MKGFVYFIGAETVGAVKIGFSRRHPRGRLKELQTGCPIPLKILAYVEGGPEQELSLHRRFSSLKIHSEWFRLEGALLDMVSWLPARQEPRPVVLPRCARCGEIEHDRNLLIGHRGVLKICRGPQFEGAER